MRSSTVSKAKKCGSSDEPCVEDPKFEVWKAFNRRRVRFRGASIELVLVPGGRLKRYVILESEKLQLALGQPRRREIESLDAQQEQFRLHLSELWRLAEHQAKKSLRVLFDRLNEPARESPARPGQQTRADRLLGEIQVAVPARGAVRGELLFAGHVENGLFSIELLEDRRRVRSIKGIDLARALEIAGAQIGDTILVEPTGQQEIAIREERSGLHGEMQRTFKGARETFRISKESESEMDSNATSAYGPPRATRSAQRRSLGEDE